MQLHAQAQTIVSAIHQEWKASQNGKETEEAGPTTAPLIRICVHYECMNDGVGQGRQPGEEMVSDWGVEGFLESVSSPFHFQFNCVSGALVFCQALSWGLTRRNGLMGALPSGSSVSGDMGSFSSWPETSTGWIMGWVSLWPWGFNLPSPWDV